MTTITKLKATLDAFEAVLRWIDDYAETTGFDTVEAMADAALPDLRSVIAEMEAGEPSPTMLKVVRGDICCKSLDMDQSYGMWVPVTYSTEHGFVDGTCFYTHPQPKAEPVQEPK